MPPTGFDNSFNTRVSYCFPLCLSPFPRPRPDARCRNSQLRKLSACPSVLVRSETDAVRATAFGDCRPRRANRGVKVVKRLKEGGWEQPGEASASASVSAPGARDLASVTYQQFLALLWGIKGPKVSRRSLGRRLLDVIVARCVHDACSWEGESDQQTNVREARVGRVWRCTLRLR